MRVSVWRWLRLAGAELPKRMAMAYRLRQETCRCVTVPEAAVRVQDAWYMQYVSLRPLFVSRDCIMSSGMLLSTPPKGALLQRSALKKTEIRPWSSYAVLAQSNR